MNRTRPGPGYPAGVFGIRWASVWTVLGAFGVALLALALLVRGRTWAWVPLVVGLGVGLREIRYLQRRRDRRNAPR